MSSELITLTGVKPTFTSQDYQALRKAGLAHLQTLSGRLWTDHNTHDPGITLLEVLCFALTDLGHRTGMDLRDLLADRPDETHPLRNFYTLSEAATMQALTLDDYRKLLIDQAGVRNAWLMHAEEAEVAIYLDRTAESLTYSSPGNEKLKLHGLYKVLLEFEKDDHFGDLNDFSQRLTTSLTIAGVGPVPFELEIKFLPWKETPDAFDILTLATADVTWLVPVPGDPQLYRFQWDLNGPGGLLMPPIHVRINKGMEKVTDLMDFRTQLKNALDNTSLALDALIFFQSKRAEVKNRCTSLRNTVLMANRNLCEDFAEVAPMDVQEIGMQLDLRVAKGHDISRVLGEIQYRIGKFLSPMVKFRSLREMLEEGKKTFDIFRGPILQHGFLRDEELDTYALRDSLYTSDLVNELMDIPGVAAIDKLTLSNFVKGVAIGVDATDCLLLTSPGQFLPRLNLQRCRIRFDQGDKVLRLADEAKAQSVLLELLAKDSGLKGAYSHEDLPIPYGEHLGIEQYASLQLDLPNAYGIGAAGLPADASAERKTQALQLKAYLLLFEQMLANYLAQLSQLRRLFSLEEIPSGNRTYFAQALYEVPAVADVLKHFIDTHTTAYTPADWAAYTDPGAAPSGYLEKLLSDSEDIPGYWERRNGFLNHLIARFNESFADYAIWSLSNDGALAPQILIGHKAAFLSDYVAASAERAKGYNYHVFPGGAGTKWPSAGNVSGLQKRVSRLLGFDGYDHADMADILDHIVVSEPSLGSWTFVLNDDTPATLLDAPGTYSTEEKAWAVVTSLLDVAKEPSNYKISTSSGIFTLAVVNNSGTVVGQRTGLASEADALDLRDAVISLLLEKDEVEHFHVVEQMLLRPMSNSDALLPVFVNPLRLDLHTLCRWEGIDRLPDLWPPTYPAAPISIMDSKMCSGPLFESLAADGKLDHLLNPHAKCMEIKDPYSFRICVVMPSWTRRFRDAAFRKLFRQTVRLETPAHVYVKFVWMDRHLLRAFEDAFAGWMKQKSGADVDEDYLEQLAAMCAGACSVYDAQYERTWTGKVSDLRVGDTIATISDPDGEPTDARLMPGASLPTGIMLHPFTGDLIVKNPSAITPGLYTNIHVGFWNSSGDHHCVSLSLTIKPDRDSRVEQSSPRPINTYQLNEVIASLVDPDGLITSVLPADLTSQLPPGISFSAVTNECYVSNVAQLRAGTYPIQITTTDESGGVTDLSFSLRLLTPSGAQVLEANRVLDPPLRLPIGTVLMLIVDGDNGVDLIASSTPDLMDSGTSGLALRMVSDAAMPFCELVLTDEVVFASWLEANDDQSDPENYTVPLSLEVVNVLGATSVAEQTLRVARNSSPALSLHSPKHVELYQEGDVLATVTDDADGGIVFASSLEEGDSLLSIYGLGMDVGPESGHSNAFRLTIADPFRFKRAAKLHFTFDPNEGLTRNFTFVLTDNKGNLDKQLITVTVLPDDAPSFNATAPLKLDTYDTGTVLGTLSCATSGGVAQVTSADLLDVGLKWALVPGAQGTPTIAQLKVTNLSQFRRALFGSRWEANSDPGKLSSTWRVEVRNQYGGSHSMQITLQVLDEMDGVFLQLVEEAAIHTLPTGTPLIVCKGQEPWAVEIGQNPPPGLTLAIGNVTSLLLVENNTLLWPDTYQILLSGIEYNGNDLSEVFTLVLGERVVNYEYRVEREGSLTLRGSSFYPGLTLDSLSLTPDPLYATAEFAISTLTLSFEETLVNAGVVISGTTTGTVADNNSEPVTVALRLLGAGGGYRRHSTPLLSSLEETLPVCTAAIAETLAATHQVFGQIDTDIFPAGWPDFAGDPSLETAYRSGERDFQIREALLPIAKTCSACVVDLAAKLKAGQQLTAQQAADLDVAGAVLGVHLAMLTEFALHIRQTDIEPGTDLNLVLEQIEIASNALN